MTGWCEETTATRCVPYIFPGLIQHLPCQGLRLHSQPERHRVNMALNQRFPGSDAAKEAVCVVGVGSMALGSRIPVPPTTSPTHEPQFPCPSGQLCSLHKETPPGLFASETQEHIFIFSVFAPRLAKLPTRSTQSMSGIAVAPGTSVTSLTRGQLTLSPESVIPPRLVLPSANEVAIARFYRLASPAD